MPNEEYRTVKIPKSLADEVDENLVGKHGFSSRAEVAKEGMRRMLLIYAVEEK